MSEPQHLSVRDTRTLPVDVRLVDAFWISNVLIRRYKLSQRAFVAYSSLAYVARSRKVVSAPISVLAKIFNLSEDTTRRGLAECEKKKVIRINKRYKKISGKATQQYLPNEYVLLNLKDDGNDPI